MLLFSKKRRSTVLYRLGIKAYYNKQRSTDKKTVWIHALSVGEVISAIPLVKGIRENFDDIEIFFSASTKTGFETVNKRLKGYVKFVFYSPYDFIFSVKKALDNIRPTAVFIVESDIWPNFLFELNKRRIFTMLINARLSKRSYLGYKKMHFIFRHIFSSFSTICTQSEEDAQKFLSIGVPFKKVKVTGNLKFDQKYEQLTKIEKETLKKSLGIGNRKKIIIAGSTHDGEERTLLNVFARLKQKNRFNNSLVLIIVPRNCNRAKNVKRLAISLGFTVNLVKSMKKKQSIESEIVIVGIMDILTELYNISDIAFVGGSLVNCGGHNPLEPAAFAKPVIFGADMSDFLESSELLEKQSGAIRVHNESELYEALKEFIENKNHVLNTGSNAFAVFSSNTGAVEKVLKIMFLGRENS